jgi:lysophospholipase L1-like esterase
MNRLIVASILLLISAVFAPIDAAVLSKGQNVKVMPLGDSITLGKTGSVGGYRKLLYEWLIAHGYSITYVGKQTTMGSPRYPLACSDGSIPYHEGYGSFRTDMILNGGTAEKQTSPPIATTLANFKPDVILLMIGTNDILQNYHLDQWEQRLGSLVAAIYANDPHATVVLATIPPLIMPKLPKYANTETRAEAYNQSIPALAAREQAAGHAIVVVDMHAALTPDGSLDKGGVHPTALGYARMAQTWYKALTGEDPPAITDLKNPLQLPAPLPSPPATNAAPVTTAPTGT